MPDTSKVVDKVKETANEDIERVKNLTNQAIKSGAYLYPLKGLVYFLFNRSLWKPLLQKLIPTISTAVGVTVAMFALTYLPQVAILALFNGPLAVVSTVLLVFSESSTITNIIARSFFIEDALIDTFDGTLLARNKGELVNEGRQVKSGGDPMARLGKIMKRPFARFTPKAIIRYFMYLPLNFIPVVGTVLFVIMQGRKFGPNAHARYFQLKKMSNKEKEEYIEKRSAAYTSFGIPAQFLELIPFVGIFFSFTNACGAALWAADLEQQGSTAPQLRAKVDSATSSGRSEL